MTLNKKTLFLTGEINEETVQPLVEELYKSQNEEVTLVINSRGGILCSAFALLDAVKANNVELTTVASGNAISCGLTLLMAGKHRFANKTANLMSHQFSSSFEGTEQNFFANQKNIRSVGEAVLAHYAHHTQLSKDLIRAELLTPLDTWLTAEEALAYNIIDQIIY